MDKYVLNLIDQIHVLLHRIDGYLDAKADLKPQYPASNEPQVIPFPVHLIKDSPFANRQKADFFDKKTVDVGETPTEEQNFVEFSDKEIKQMPQTLQRILIINHKRCRVRKHISGSTTTTYEIRFRQDGYNVSACGKTLELAKANMLKKLRKAKRVVKQNGVPNTFHAFATYLFEHFRVKKVSALTYKFDLLRYKRWLEPHFQEKPLKRITPLDCQTLLDNISAEGKTKTALEIYSIMSVIFKGAIAHNLLDRNPLALVIKPTHETESGSALSKDEENTLFQRVAGTPYEIVVALALYCGLRPNELKTATVRGEFIVAINSKRKTKKVEYKRIPIINKLKPFIQEGKQFVIPYLDPLRQIIRNLLPGHKLYDLRTTFYTRCKEYGVADAARDHFVGHSLGAIGNTYTDLSDEYLLKEGKKLNEW